MEVLTIEHSAFQQLISKIEAMDEYIRKAKLEQQSSLDDDWVDGQAVCEYLCICNHPYDNKVFDHGGERIVTNAIVAVKRNFWQRLGYAIDNLFR